MTDTENKELIENLMQLNKLTTDCEEIYINGEGYKIMNVTYFEDAYDYDDEYDGKLREFIKSLVNGGHADFLDEAGIDVISKYDDIYAEQTFISFVDLATKYKGSVELKQSSTVLSI